jgi:hypothetical protein
MTMTAREAVLKAAEMCEQRAIFPTGITHGERVNANHVLMSAADEIRAFADTLTEGPQTERDAARKRWKEMASKMREIWCRRVHDLQPPLTDEEIAWADEYVTMSADNDRAKDAT